MDYKKSIQSNLGLRCKDSHGNLITSYDALLHIYTKLASSFSAQHQDLLDKTLKYEQLIIKHNDLWRKFKEIERQNNYLKALPFPLKVHNEYQYTVIKASLDSLIEKYHETRTFIDALEDQVFTILKSLSEGKASLNMKKYDKFHEMWNAGLLRPLLCQLQHERCRCFSKSKLDHEIENQSPFTNLNRNANSQSKLPKNQGNGCSVFEKSSNYISDKHLHLESRKPNANTLKQLDQFKERSNCTPNYLESTTRQTNSVINSERTNYDLFNNQRGKENKVKCQLESNSIQVPDRFCAQDLKNAENSRSAIFPECPHSPSLKYESSLPQKHNLKNISNENSCQTIFGSGHQPAIGNASCARSGDIHQSEILYNANYGMTDVQPSASMGMPSTSARIKIFSEELFLAEDYQHQNADYGIAKDFQPNTTMQRRSTPPKIQILSEEPLAEDYPHPIVDYGMAIDYQSNASMQRSIPSKIPILSEEPLVEDFQHQNAGYGMTTDYQPNASMHRRSIPSKIQVLSEKTLAEDYKQQAWSCSVAFENDSPTSRQVLKIHFNQTFVIDGLSELKEDTRLINSLSQIFPAIPKRLLRENICKFQVDNREYLHQVPFHEIVQELLTYRIDSLESKEKCPICIHPFGEYDYLNLDCSHKFHKVCLYGWFLFAKQCPRCKMPI